MTGGKWLRLRVFTGGTLADEQWIDTASPDCLRLAEETQKRHVALVEQAVRDGRPWLVETYDPGQPEGSRYIRVGTDTRGMRVPAAAEWQQIERQVEAELKRRYRKDPD